MQPNMSNSIENPQTITRINVVDSLRGFALMGLFLVHMVSFFGLHWLQPKESFSFDAVMWLFGGKSYALFALLFGLSFFIIMNGKARKNVDFRSRFCWRMIILFLFGYVHSLFYSSDVLQVLALTGILLVTLYSLGNRLLLVTSLFFLLQIPTYCFLVYLAYHPEVANSNPNFYELTGMTNHVAATGSFMDVLLTNAYQSHLGKWSYYIESARLWNIFGFCTLGLWVGRIGLFSQFDKYKKAYISALFLSVIIAFLMYLIAQCFNQTPFQQSLVGWSVFTIIYSYINAALMIATGIILVLCSQLNFLTKFLNHLAPCGRMTLTLYVGQSIFFTPIFFNYGLGLHQTITHEFAIILFLFLWVTQVIFANIWFKHFQYGPLEWIWKVATYTRTDIPFRMTS